MAIKTDAEAAKGCDTCGPADDPTCFVECVCACHDAEEADYLYEGDASNTQYLDEWKRQLS